MTVSSFHPDTPKGTPTVESAREQLDTLSAYRERGSYRTAAAPCGTSQKTVRRVVQRRATPPAGHPPRAQEHGPPSGC
jgi:hypothetical protein